MLDNCHVRVSFATNDERTAKRVSDALGTATEMKAQRNYAGHRLSPWLGHLMVSRQETARPLLTAGEVMQLPPVDELVLVSGLHPIRAKKARYYEDPRLNSRVLPPPKRAAAEMPLQPVSDQWTALPVRNSPPNIQAQKADEGAEGEDSANAGIRREPELPEHEQVAPEPPKPAREFAFEEDEADQEQAAVKNRVLRTHLRSVARQASMDPGDGIAL